MIDNFTQLFLIFIAIIFLIAFGFFIFKLKINRDNKRKAAEFYKISAELFFNNSYAYSLFTLGKSIVIYEHHQSYNLLGHIYEKLGLYDLEAEAFYRARRVAYYINPLATDRYNQEVTYYFYRESLAYTKTKNWEFSYLRSDQAIKMIHTENLSAFVDDKNIEVELRVIRMISSLFFFKGKEAFEKSQDDASWLRNNSTDNTLKILGESLNEASSFVNDNEFSRILIERCFGKIYPN